MAKKKPPNGQLFDPDNTPKSVRDAADVYDSAHTAKTKAQGKLNTAKESLIEKMRQNGIERVRIRNGEKFLVVSATDKINYKKPAEEKRDEE